MIDKITNLSSKLITCYPPLPASPDAWERVKYAYIYTIYSNIHNFLQKIVPNVPNSEDKPPSAVIDDMV